jgi:hypothetical protein
MTSAIHRTDVHDSNVILKKMMARAHYVTSDMRPLPGPLFQTSVHILENFLSGVMHEHLPDLPPVTGRTASVTAP